MGVFYFIFFKIFNKLTFLFNFGLPEISRRQMIRDEGVQLTTVLGTAGLRCILGGWVDFCPLMWTKMNTFAVL